MSYDRYFIVGLLPVRFVPTPDGGLAVWKMNWKTCEFEYGMEYFAEATSSHSDLEEVTDDEFIQHIESLRAARLKDGEGPLPTLYQLINGIEETAKKEKRALTGEEKQFLAELKRKTYTMFRADHPDPPFG